MIKRPKRRPARKAPEQARDARTQALKRLLRDHFWTLLIALLCLIALVLLIVVIGGGKPRQEQPTVQQTDNPVRYEDGFLCGSTPQIAYYDAQLQQSGSAARGEKVTYTTRDPLERDGHTYYMTYFETLDFGYVDSLSLTQDETSIVQEKTVYVRTPQNLRAAEDTLALGALVPQGTALTVLGYDSLYNGVVNLYRVSCQGQTGYISGQYVCTSEDEAKEVYDRFGVYTVHAGRGDDWGGGDGESLDYYPREKASFSDNVMPERCCSLYLTCDPDVLAHVDDYIAYAKSTSINAFVVNIMDGTSIGYPSEVYLQYSPTAYQYANNTTEEYRAAIRKIKDAGFYCIGRLTTFNDSHFVTDHPEYAIADGSGAPLYVAGSYWPSAFCRYAWEYKVALAIDAVQTMGFDEIQFDYVRFPDSTYAYEQDGNIDYRNTYGETKAQAIQRFLMYAADILHTYGVYVGADVFGETCGTYVTAYGQYWPAISNVVDVISGMPYPDHFSQNGNYRPWEHPYETLLDWAESAAKRQAETPSPAVARTWIQAYDAIRPPYNAYGAEEVGGQLRALEEAGLTGGFMAWNASCSLEKLQALKPAFDALTE